MNKIHFCGGLPRAGSTVLMNILQQNPRIFTTGTCALYEILKEKILIKGRYSETFQAMSTDQADRAMQQTSCDQQAAWMEQSISSLSPQPFCVHDKRSTRCGRKF